MSKIEKDEINESYEFKPLHNEEKTIESMKLQYEVNEIALKQSTLNAEILKITEVSFIEKIYLIITKMPILIDIIYNVLLLRNLIMNKDKNSNYAAIVSGILVVIFAILKIFNLDIPIETQNMITDTIVILIGLIVTIIGYFTGKPTDTAGNVTK